VLLFYRWVSRVTARFDHHSVEFRTGTCVAGKSLSLSLSLLLSLSFPCISHKRLYWSAGVNTVKNNNSNNKRNNTVSFVNDPALNTLSQPFSISLPFLSHSPSLIASLAAGYLLVLFLAHASLSPLVSFGLVWFGIRLRLFIHGVWGDSVSGGGWNSHFALI